MGEFGDYISKKRKEKDISLRTMARDLGISVSYLSDLEQGHKLPPNSAKDKYKNLLLIIMDYLELTDEEKNRCQSLADTDLVKNGYVSNDITNYMGQTPLANVALRKAKDLNYSDDDWKKIIETLEK